MNNVEAILYTKKLTTILDKEGLFQPEVDIFLDKQLLYEEMLPMAEENMIKNGIPDLSDAQFDMAIEISRGKCFDNTTQSLFQKGLLELKSIDGDGEIISGLVPELVLR